jgi:molybdopterin converting factor subunit 1
MKKVHVQFFAAFRDQAGTAQVEVSTVAATVSELFDELCADRAALTRYPAMKFALNDQLVAADATLSNGDSVLFFPPVAGG